VWPPEALEFLEELEANNDRDWFRANRHRYEEHLVAPARKLGGKLTDLGEVHFFRPWNNTRFRPGPPLKEHLAMTVGAGPAVYYLQLSLDGLLVGGGLHHPARDQLDHFRAAIDDPRKGAAFERAIEQAKASGLDPIEPELKRAPKGYSPDHPRIEWLRMKHLTVFDRHELGRWLHTATCDKRVRDQFHAATPFVQWINNRVGPSTEPAGSQNTRPPRRARPTGA
jgi:uncharacterized protein (TIGR02453 family)